MASSPPTLRNEDEDPAPSRSLSGWYAADLTFKKQFCKEANEASFTGAAEGEGEGFLEEEGASRQKLKEASEKEGLPPSPTALSCPLFLLPWITTIAPTPAWPGRSTSKSAVSKAVFQKCKVQI